MKTIKKNLARNRRHARIRAIVKGTAKRPRLVVSRSLQNHFVQLVNDDKGVTLASASDIKEKKGKESRTASAKKLGLKIAELAKGKKVTQCVFDRNGCKYHGRIKAVAEGAREGGLKF
jgi:large subunit ribosomal protein L18